MSPPPVEPPEPTPATVPPLTEMAREWGRIGCVGFGGPPAHVALLRELVVEERGWLPPAQFEQAIAASNLLPGPASTQLAIYCAWRLRGPRGALLGGFSFIAPGLVAMIALSVLFLAGSPPAWLRGAGLGAGAAVAAVAVRAGLTVAGPIWRRTPPAARPRTLVYALATGASAALAGPWIALVLLSCGLVELALGGWANHGRSTLNAHALPVLLASALATGGIGDLAWTAFKVGALAFGGGFVIVPLMQGDAVNVYHWMTHSQFLDAVALGQVTPGPVTQTVAAVGYAAAGLPGALLAALVAFAPSFAFVLVGAPRFARLVKDVRVQAFLAGAAPAAAGAILGAAIPLAGAIAETWQYAILAAAAVALLALRRGVVQTLLLAGAAGTVAALVGATIPA